MTLLSPEVKPPISHNGEFTIESPRGGHRTFRIKTAGSRSKLAGKRILSLMTGPDNTSDYMGFAFVADDGTAFKLWRRFPDNGDHAKFAAMLRDMLTHRESSRYYALGYRLHESTVCRVCNRKLTTPESILSGIGPICDGRSL